MSLPERHLCALAHQPSCHLHHLILSNERKLTIENFIFAGPVLHASVLHARQLGSILANPREQMKREMGRFPEDMDAGRIEGDPF